MFLGWVERHRHIPVLTAVALILGLLVLQIRFALFGDTMEPRVTLLLAPIGEDALKLGFAMLFLLLATSMINLLVADKHSSSVRLTRKMLVFVPLLAALPVAAADNPVSLNTLFGHMASVSLGFGACLCAWRYVRPTVGLLMGVAAGAFVHSLLNTWYWWPLSPVNGIHFAVALVLLVVGVLLLSSLVGKEPSSDTSLEFFPPGTERTHASLRAERR